MAGHVVDLETPAWPSTHGGEAEQRVGFFTDTSVCIGCKACEVACKEWNRVPAEPQGFLGSSYDNSGELGADRWRHVAFVEQKLPVGVEGAAPDSFVREAARQNLVEEGLEPHSDDDGFRWLMSSDVCKHCTEAGCLDACPTGAIFRTEFGTVVVQEDICNGCGYCVVACPFGVLDRREEDGRVWKCTLCYDRLKDGMEPACAQACPTDSIQFGPLGELRERAEKRVENLHQRGHEEARLYGDSDDDGVGGFGAFFLLLDEPETYRLPPDPVVPTRHAGQVWGAGLLAAAGLVAGVLAACAGGRR
ncbi:MAG TPA: 4Fe-4S dicluster domain-containing protein [Solirubrobacterales bacterium]|jgi:formate dehydrogenase iron-sulfur subunit